MLLPETVSPGQLITADLINAMLEALRGYQQFAVSMESLAKSAAGFESRLSRLEGRVSLIDTDRGDLRGLINSLQHDRDDLVLKVDDIRGHVLPDFEKRFTLISTQIAERVNPLEQRLGQVEIRVLRDTDPIEQLPGITSDQINRFHTSGIANIGDAVKRRAEVSGIFGNTPDATHIDSQLGQIQLIVH